MRVHSGKVGGPTVEDYQGLQRRVATLKAKFTAMAMAKATPQGEMANNLRAPVSPRQWEKESSALQDTQWRGFLWRWPSEGQKGLELLDKASQGNWGPARDNLCCRQKAGPYWNRWFVHTKILMVILTYSTSKNYGVLDVAVSHRLFVVRAPYVYFRLRPSVVRVSKRTVTLNRSVTHNCVKWLL